jgi:heme/copper-type cytochrome/quinol oxidase subunit 2
MTLDNKFGEEILHKIKDEKLQPKPRWQFLLKDYVVWAVGGLALFLGSAAMSLIFYMASHEDIGAYQRAGGKPLEILFLVVPFFWLLCLAFFVFIVWYNVKHTKKGYRYPLPIMLAVIIGASVLLGGIFYAIGFGEKVDDELGRRAPFYDRVMNPHVDFWSQPERGRLMGMIISQNGDNEYVLVNREREEWKLLTTDAKQLAGIKIEVGRPINVLGKVSDDNIFQVTEILPAMPGKGFFEHLEPLAQPQAIGDISKNMQNNCPGPQQIEDSFSLLLEKYPEIKNIFISDLLENKSQIQKMIEKNPEFIRDLENLNIGMEAIGQLQK